MNESLQEQIAALAEMVGRLPARRLSGRAIGEPQSDPAGPPPADRSELEDRWEELGPRLPPIAGRQVLVLGDSAAADARALAERGAGGVTVLGSAPPAVSANGSVPSVRWADADSLEGELFDVVHCGQLLHRSPDPMGLLRLLRAMVRPTGRLVLALTMLADPERSEYLRYLPGEDTPDDRVWFIPGRLAVRWMLQTAGFDVRDEFGEQPGPRHGVATVCSYVRAEPARGSSAPDPERSADALGARVAAGPAGRDGHRPTPAG